MNPLIQSQLTEINRQVQALRDAVAQANEKDALHAQDQERTQQEQWRYRKEIATLQRIAKDYDALETENDRLTDLNHDVRNRLRRILACTKALTAEFKP